MYIQFSIPGRSSLDVVSFGTQYDEADRKFVDDSASTVIFRAREIWAVEMTA
jgi:hypothetical protein